MHEQVSHLADKVSAASYSTAGGTIMFAGLTTNDFAMLAGVVIGLATFIVNWVYRSRADMLAKARFDYDKMRDEAREENAQRGLK